MKAGTRVNLVDAYQYKDYTIEVRRAAGRLYRYRASITPIYGAGRRAIPGVFNDPTEAAKAAEAYIDHKR